MKKFPFYSLLLLLFLFSENPVFAGNKSLVQLQVNWPEYLSKHDLVWNRIPENYYEGAYVGNGLLGTILYRDNLKENTIRFEIGRCDVYDHRSIASGFDPFSRVRLPIGQLLLTPAGDIQKSSFRTDLWNAEIRGEIITTKGRITICCYVPSGEKVIILKLKSDQGERTASLTFRPEQGDCSRVRLRPSPGMTYQHNPPFRVEKINGIEVVTQPLWVGDDYATAWNEVQEPDDTRSVYITVANRWAEKHSPGNGSAADAVATIEAARKKNEVAVQKAHRQWWHSFYPASFVTFPDPRLESFYWIQQYRLGSAGHPDQPPIDLLGPWYLPTVWLSLWMNLNVQLTYYTAGVSNHPEMEEPLYLLLDRHAGKLNLNVTKEFQNDCAAILNPAGFDDLSGNVYLTNDTASVKPMNIIVLPWLMHQYFIHYRFSMDDQRLREHVYPLMKKTFAVYLRILYKSSDGKYHLPLTFSDEYGDDKDVSMNIALARWGFQTLISCAERLQIKDPDLPRWKDALSNMVYYPIDERGIMIGRNTPFAKPHRHYSHIFAIFPLYEMNIENRPDLIPMMKKTVQNFTSLDGDNCMFKFSGASSIWAALGDGNEALNWLNRSLKILPGRIPTVTSNGFYSEAGWPTFESPISSCRAALDMLIQSWGGKIRIFPALPDEWKDVCFHDLRAEGAFLVSAAREAGKTKFIRIKSLAGEPCIIKCDLEGKIKLIAPKTVLLKKRNNEIALNLKKGEEAILYVGEKPDNFIIHPLSMVGKKFNQWGGMLQN
ncbi:MAG: hypothetical protein Q8907_12410 [Bacteroidota bacterium]|nr:hypothetical protein [Bacteroidota bacterium]